MQVCLDIQAAIAQRAGVGRYTQMLIECLPEGAAEADRLRLFYFDFRKRGQPFDVPSPRIEFKAVEKVPGRLVQQLWKWADWPPFDLFSGPADLFHFPNFIIPPLPRGKAVVTIHDMSFHRFPQFTESRNLSYLSKAIGHTARRADAIITDSHFSANEISACLGVEKSRVHAIHLGISPSLQAPPPEILADLRRRHKLDKPYLLTVGTIEPRKNLPLLLDLFENFRDFDGDLVIAGMPGWKCASFFERLKTSPAASRIRYLDFLPEPDLPALYAAAEAFVFPSFYEGFGFPPLEAMACGTPVIASRGGSLPEVLGEAASFPLTWDVEEWRGAVRQVLSDSTLRQTLIERGLRQAARYRWSETARQTWQVYRQVAG
jgi:glycosyltransferase involved in cell wall biosynthesis